MHCAHAWTAHVHSPPPHSQTQTLNGTIHPAALRPQHRSGRPCECPAAAETSQGQKACAAHVMAPSQKSAWHFPDVPDAALCCDVVCRWRSHRSMPRGTMHAALQTPCVAAPWATYSWTAARSRGHGALAAMAARARDGCESGGLPHRQPHGDSTLTGKRGRMTAVTLAMCVRM